MATNKPGISVYKMVRLIIALGMLGAIGLMLKRPPAPAPPINAEKVAANAEQFNAKLEELRSATEHGESGKEVGFTSDEVNSFIADASARAAQPQPPPQSGPAAAEGAQAEAPTAASTQVPSQTPTEEQGSAGSAPAAPLDAAAIEQVRAAIKQTQLAFEGNEVVAQAVVQRYGQDIVVTVRGTLGVQNGYLAFTPTGFKIGSLAVPVSMVEERLKAKLAEPENREKFKLPDFISDLRVENGQLRIVQK
jgi:hypothetical protein